MPKIPLQFLFESAFQKKKNLQYKEYILEEEKFALQEVHSRREEISITKSAF